MNTVAEQPADSTSRWTRERTFWNAAYDPRGAHNARYVWVKNIENQAYLYQYLRGRLKPFTGKRILSLGGGLDWVGVDLARAGNAVVSVDISPVAAARTTHLACQEGVGQSLSAVVANGEALPFPRGRFDVVFCKRALHHMNLARVIHQVRDLLAPGGVFIAEEPICLLRPFQWLHRQFPFAPEAPRTPDEKELTVPDLELVRRTFPAARFRFFDLCSRESVAYLLSKARLIRLLRPLGRLDYVLINGCFPPLKYLSSYVLIEAVKSDEQAT